MLLLVRLSYVTKLLGDVSVITIFVCNTGGGGGGRRRLLYNFENSISTAGQGLITAPVGNGTGKIAGQYQESWD